LRDDYRRDDYRSNNDRRRGDHHDCRRPLRIRPLWSWLRRS
jgi:hypothetical protein